MKNIVLFGPPGSGKGTQASNIIDKYHLIHLSTGDMLRAEIAAQSKLGLEAKSLMDRGELVPDSVVIGMIENKLDANPGAAGFVFDGFPRTVGQAEALDKLLAKRNAPIQKVLSLKVSEDELTKRILERGKTSGRPDDQNPEIVKNRVVEYRTKTEPLATYYAKQNKLVEIQGEGTVDHISDLLYYEIDSIGDHMVKTHFPAPVEMASVAEDKVTLPSPEKALAKPAAKKETAKASAKKAAPKRAANPSPKKAVKKEATKKAPKKVATKKPIAKKIVKKAATKKTVKKAPAKKVVKKVAPKKPLAKKVLKKAAPKKVVRKAPAKKIVAKKDIKKAAPKKALKKVAARKAVVKKAAKKAAPKKAAIKKAIAKKVAKKAAPKKVAKKKGRK